MEKSCWQNLSETEQKLLTEAHEALKLSYSPYSQFCVGAALLTQDDEIIRGTNVENASYGMTICAERGALMHAHALGKRRFKAIAVVGKGESGPEDTLATPCGACRQMLFEAAQVSGGALKVIMSSADKSKIFLSTTDALLPHGFGPKDLGIDVAS